MDKFSYAIGLGIGQNLLSMGAQSICVEDFAQAISDVLNRIPPSPKSLRPRMPRRRELFHYQAVCNIWLFKKVMERNLVQPIV